MVALEAVLFGLLLWRPVVEARIEPSKIQHVGGRQYLVTLSGLAPPGYVLLGDSNTTPRRSSLVLLRDGRSLGPAHTVHDTVRSVGEGAFSHWGNGLYFSTPGNTDPRTDGHAYVLHARATLAPVMEALLVAIIVVVGAQLWRGSGAWSLVRGLGFVPLKLMALAVVWVAAPWGWVWPVVRQADLLMAAGRFELLSVYVAAVGAALAGLLVVPFLRDWRIRVPLVVLLLVAFAADQIILSLSGQPMALEMMRTLWRERAEVGDALSAYGPTIVGRASLAALLAVTFALPPTGRWRLGRRFGLVPVAALVGVAGLIYATDGRTEAFPAPFAGPAQLAIALLPSPSHDVVERPPVEYGWPVHSPFTKIVMIVDESVRGDYLGLNNPSYDNTPTLSAMGDALANYGTAISATNCSAAARLILRVGLQKHQLPDTREVWRRQPTIWQYAHRAGYKTVLIDAFGPVGQFHSYMDAQEARAIDVTLAVHENPHYSRDRTVAGMLVDLLRRDEPMFIYVNKYGVHPYYKNRFPPDLAYDPSPLVASLPLDGHRRDVVRDYHKALRWSVDEFFRTMRPALYSPTTIVLYTSDHGQSLFEGGYELSHCSLTIDLHRGEVFVPLFTITTAPGVGARLKAESVRAFDHATHYEVFPTLLELMGYSPEWVDKRYGPSLLRIPVERRRGFLMGTFFHPTAVWLDADRGGP